MEKIKRNKDIISRLYNEVFEKWDFSVLDELISPDFVGHDWPQGFPPGSEGFGMFYDYLRTAFPDSYFDIEDLIGEDEKVVVRWRQEGLKVPQKQPKRGRLWLNDGSCVRLRPMHQNHVWSYDFVHDRTQDHRTDRY